MSMLQPSEGSIFYVTGPLHSGKTTRLRTWSRGRADVGGIFQPVMDGKRYFEDIRTGEQMPMDAPPEQEQVFIIGKYRFAPSAFTWAADVLAEALEDAATQYLIIDEIGPLEMRNEGLHTLLYDLLESPMPGLRIILVVRDYLLQDVLKKYGVEKQAEAFLY